MINKIVILNNEDLNNSHVSDLPAFSNGKEYNFTEGINIIIGKNGCGKTSLLNMLYGYMLCNKSMKSQLPRTALDWPKLFKEDNSVYSGIKIVADYRLSTFRMLEQMNNDESLENFSNFALCINKKSSSTGEGILYSLDALFNVMFNPNTDLRFPKLNKGVNATWQQRFTNLFDYYKENQINSNAVFTVLMDEPDRNLDIDKIDEIYNILSTQKPNTQLIAVIHNPLLIYKLSKLKYINFIEMSDNYLNSATNCVTKLL